MRAIARTGNVCRRVYASRAAEGVRALHGSAVARRQGSGDNNDEGFRLKDLMAKFNDPKSPYYMAPGEVGPASPEDYTVSRPLPGHADKPGAADWTPPAFTVPDPVLPHMSREYDRARATAHEWFDSNGFDPLGRIEWPVAWGDSDMYRHINNVSYGRYVESARMRWVESLVPDLGEMGENFLYGRHTGFILKEQSIRYRYPMTYPDAIVLASKPHSINQERGQFIIAAAGWSLKANKLAITADSVCTMYDFDNLKKGKMSDKLRDVLLKRGDA